MAVIGNFDGVHLGHQAIFAQARQIAQARRLPLVAMTFDPAPVRILRPDKAPRLLTPMEIKIPLLREQGLDHLLIIKPDPAFLELSPEVFTRQILVEKLGVRHVVEGPSFNFGRKGAGGIISLQELAYKMGFQAHLVSSRLITLGQEGPLAVSSTLIRRLITHNRFDDARECLGRYHGLAGKIVRGKGAGRGLGFPTANLELYHPQQLFPADGVYAGFAWLAESGEALQSKIQNLKSKFSEWQSENAPAENAETARVLSQPYLAAISIGPCQTFAGAAWQIEAHLWRRDGQGGRHGDLGDLYGRHLLLGLVEHLRGQVKFADLAELSRAMEQDCRRVEEILINV